MDLRNLPLATTPAGRQFALKCLHPADHEIKTNRGPGGLMPSVGLCSDTIQSIPIPAGAVNAHIIQTPNLWIPCTVTYTDANDAFVDSYTFTNTALGGNLHHWNGTTDYIDVTGMIGTWADKIDQYRVTAQSITVEHVAPMITDQGVVTSCQYRDRPQTIQMSSYGRSDGDTFDYANAIQDAWVYTPPPSTAMFLQGTNAYTAKLKEGFYQPLKLSSFKFQSIEDAVVYMTRPNHRNATIIAPGVMRPPQLTYPFYLGSQGAYPLSATYALPRMSCDAIGYTYISGFTAGSTALRIRVRQVSELIVPLNSTYAALTDAPYPPDETAYRMVREIGARMKDAYPAAYNATGKLKEIVEKIGSKVLPFVEPALNTLSVLPPAQPFVQAAKLGLQIAKNLKPLQPTRPAPPVPDVAPWQPSGRRRKRGGRGRRNLKAKQK